MNPTRIERIVWNLLILPIAGAAAIDPNPRTLGAIAGIIAAKWTGSILILGAHSALSGGDDLPTPGGRVNDRNHHERTNPAE